MPDAYLSIRDVEHPLATLRGILREHQRVLFDKVGDGPHPCHWCGRSVDWLPGNRTRIGKLVTDHLDENGRNNAPENLVPSCQPCNTGRNNPRRVRSNEVFLIIRGIRVRAVERICGQCHATFKATLHKAKLGHDRFCSRECANIGKGSTRVTAEQVRSIRALAQQGASYNEIAPRFAITASNVSMIVRRKSWQHI